MALDSNKVVAFESLSRFAMPPPRTPDLWFAEAAEVGKGIELELKAVELALLGLAHLPADVYI